MAVLPSQKSFCQPPRYFKADICQFSLTGIDANFQWFKQCMYNQLMLPEHFEKAIQKIQALEEHKQYLGAFVFGSVARGAVTAESDLDAIILVQEDADNCSFVSHPYIEGIKGDISFLSRSQMTRNFEAQKLNGRIPMIAESKILFDKHGVLEELKNEYSVSREKLPAKYFKTKYYGLHHVNEKIERNLHSDPDTALLAMHMGLNDLLKVHYEINGKWWVSDKRLLSNLAEWDPNLEKLLRTYVQETETKNKFSTWQKMFAHVTTPLGGKIPIESICCDCKSCTQNLQNLKESR